MGIFWQNIHFSEQPEKNIVPAPLPSVPEMHGSSPKWSDALAILSPFTEQAPVVLLRSIRQLRGQSVHSGILFSFKKPLLLRSGQVSAYYSDVVVPEDAAEEVSLSALLSAEEAEASDDVSSSLVMFSFS